ncbi:MAG: SRPBCC domain-containing protein [Vicinamibacterales bacterium]
MPNTVRFHRVLRARPERVYRGFLDPDAMVKWLPPNGFTGKVHHVDARVGGIALKPVSCGAELNITQEGIPDVIPPEACTLGWQESLRLLAALVEAAIPE